LSQWLLFDAVEEARRERSYEICKWGLTYDGDHVTVDFVSLNDSSSIRQCDQEIPLQALLKSFVFAAIKTTCRINRKPYAQFSKFPDEDYAITIAASLGNAS
jgi:hypothetical protein